MRVISNIDLGEILEYQNIFNGYSVAEKQTNL